MDKRFLFFFFVMVIPLKSYCQNIDSISRFLKGKWEWIGFYKNDQPQYDTLSTEIEDHFEPYYHSETFIYIWTDSGTYVHQYQTEELIGIELSTKSSITEFIFVGNQSGKVLDYEIDLNGEGGEDPRFTDFNYFRIEDRALIYKDFDLEGKVGVDKITEDELILEFEDGSTSRFKKYIDKP